MIRSFIRRVKQSFLDLQIRKKLLLSFAVLIALPVTLMAVFYLTNSKVILERKSSNYTADILTELCKNIENTSSALDSAYVQLTNNEGVQRMLTAIAQNEHFSLDDNSIDAALRDVMYGHSSVNSIYLLTYDDPSLCFSVPQGTSPEITEESLAIIDNNPYNASWLNLKPGMVTYGRVIYSTKSLTPLGYLIVNMPEESLFKIYSDISLYKDGGIFITDHSGIILSHEDKSLLYSQVGPDYLTFIHDPSDTPFSLRSIDGENYYIACKSLNQGQWYLFYQISAYDFEKDFFTLTQVFFVITLVILILTLTVSVFLAKSISDPISKLTVSVQKVQNGDFNIHNDYSSKDEVGLLSDSFNAMIDNTNELIQTIYQKELLKQQAELKYLQFQINPHFLYNTLETINWISRIRGVPEAGEIAKALGDLMREGLRDDDFVTIEREIKNVQNYLLIQKYRYGDKIDVTINIEPSITQVKTPKFILQPIIENAISHGVDPKIEGGKISIFGGCDGRDILITIEDDGVGIPPDKLRNLLNENLRKNQENSRHTHIGLLNVHKRLQLSFGPQYGLVIHSEVGVGTVVTIRLPHDVPEPPPQN
ncbi:MAG: sensor histidine kinase [Oscillospiraceae bacterium]|jgi:two-component system sensor histidine kinase YesM